MARKDVFPSKDDAEKGDADTTIFVTPGGQGPVTDGNGIPLPTGDYTINGKPTRVISQTMSGPRYGEVGSTTLGEETHTKTGINWGSVMKGVAIVTAVVAVGVVGYLALSSLAVAALHTTAGAALYSGAAHAATVASGMLGHAAGYAVNFLGGAAGSLGITTAATGSAALAPATVAAASHTAAIAGAAVATTAALPTALSHLNQLPLTSTTTVTTPIVETHVTPDHSVHVSAGKSTMFDAHQLQELTHVSHHATEHHSKPHVVSDPAALSMADRRATDNLSVGAESSRNWMDRVGSTHKAATFAGNVRTDATKPSIQPRNPNFAAELEADSSRLQTALTK